MKYFFFLVIHLSLSTYCLAQEKKEKGNTPDYSISGDAQLLSQFVYKGLGFSDNNPAMNASFLANLGSQVKLGVWGSNISNLSAVDDNFWLRFVAKVDVFFSDKFKVNVFLYDNHFYKSNQRDGLNIGGDFTYKSFEFGLEWMNNLEGTKASAEYLWVGKLFDYKKNFKFGGYAGTTISHVGTIQSWVDLKIVGQYIISPIAYAEIGATLNSNTSQFGNRDDPTVYTGVKLSY